MKVQLSERMTGMAASAVREILKIAERPDILSFAGGLPAPELFPIEAIARAHAEVFAREGAAALQYSTTEGYGPLREWICARLRRQGMEAEAERLLITAGSQQGIDLAARVLLNPKDAVAVESPSYLAALQCFSGYQARFVPVPSDEAGMRTDALARLLARERVRLIYLVPNFQNPTGRTLSLERREEVVELARRFEVPVLEDDPYGELRFRGEPLPSLAALDRDGWVVSLSTFSKTLAPGLRIGWAIGPKEVIRAMTVAKQASDLHTGTLAQRATAELLSTFDYDGHLERLRATYGERCQAMLAALERYMPKGIRWTRPDGGLFVWLELPGGLRAEDLFARALADKVAFVPGSPFFPTDEGYGFLRLNFSNRPPELIDEGMRRLGSVIHGALLERAERAAAVQ